MEATNYQIINYSEKAIALVGDTKSIKEQLKAIGGKFNPRLSCGAGWIFSLKMRERVEALINGGEVKVERRPIPYAIQDKLSDLMEEYGEDNDLCEGWWLAEADIEDVYLTGTDEQSELTDKQKASELLSFMEDELDGKAIINALNPYLKDSDLASLYDKLVKDNVIRQ